MTKVYGGHGPLEIPEWINQNAEVPRRTNYELLENLLILVVLVLAVVGIFTLGANYGEEVGERTATQEVCGDLPDSQHFSERCR